MYTVYNEVFVSWFKFCIYVFVYSEINVCVSIHLFQNPPKC